MALLRLRWIVLLSLALLQGLGAQDPAADIPHIDTCNFCTKCIVDEQPQTLQITQFNSPPVSAGTPPEHQGRTQVQTRYGVLLEPSDVQQKALLPNCSVCRGCNMEVSDISATHVRFQNMHFQHGKGATNGRIFFTKTPGNPNRYILKVFCIPISKVRRMQRPVTCSTRQASERVELLLAQQKLLEDCGMQEITPKVWLTKVSAVLPESGYHVRWHGLMMEEARGITLHALALSRESRLVMQLLQHNLNRTQVQLAAIWDLFTSQCDRHAENVFVDQNGNLQIIDNDKAMGVVSKCGFDSMLLPGTRYHSVLRVGFWSHLADYYRAQRSKDPHFCRGMVDPRFVIDYRCTVPGGKLGTDYPPAFQRCAAKLSAMSSTEIMTEYGLTNTLRAEALKSRATDMLSRGFEWTMKNGAPQNSPRYVLPHQPPCCGLAQYNRMITCDKCWSPLLPEDFTNSTDLALVTSLINRAASDVPRRTTVKVVQVTRATYDHGTGG